MPFLRENLWLRNKPSSSHQTTTPRNPGALPVLPPLLHPEQHGAKAHRAGAQAPGQPQDDPHQVWVDEGFAGPSVRPPEHRCFLRVATLTAGSAG